MGAIKDRSTVDLATAVRFSQLTVDSCDHTWLAIILGGVKDAADGYCKNSFVIEDKFECPILDDDGLEQEREIDDGVEMWILRKFTRAATYRTAGSNEISDAEVGSIKLDKKDWAELMPFVRFNEPRIDENSDSNLSYRAIRPYRDYFI